MADTDYLAASDGTGDAALMHVTTPRTAGATIIQVDTVTGVPAFFIGTWGTLLSTGFIDPATKRDFFGHVNAGTLVIDKMAPGNTDGGNTTGQVVVIKPSTPTQNLVGNFVKTAINNFGEGQLLNGKIVSSVGTNNLTVAIKTLNGVDPSTTDVVYVRIGNTVRAITAPLSVTKNAGTNWFNAGSASLAAQEIDYFVYLGYNATDGVTIGFSRIPYARSYGDFSAVTTNELYAAISTITNAASTDVYENIGRFNAILGVSATYNWSIPATSIIINMPTFATRDLSFSPQWLNLTAGNGVAVGFYKVLHRRVSFQTRLTFGTTTTQGSDPRFVAPFSHNAKYAAAGITTPFGHSMYSHAGSFYHGTCGVPTDGAVANIQPYALAAAGAFTNVSGYTATVPAAFGNGDVSWADGAYDLP